MKVLWLTNVPSPYRLAFFRELGKKCELTVLFEKSTSDERDASWRRYRFDGFEGVILRGASLNTDTAFCPSVVNYLDRNKYDHIVVTNISSPTGILAIQWMKRKNLPYWIEGDGAFAKDGKGLKERLKRALISGAHGCFSTGAMHDRYYLTYGAEASRIVRYPFSSVARSDILPGLLSAEEKETIRKKHGLPDKPIVITVGQFIRRKGFDLLLQCAAALRETAFYFVGGEATEEYLAIQRELRLENTHFVGYCDKETLWDYYRASDLFVLPTREDIWGLVINEAMANALPVISTERCQAAMELVENDENGFVVPTEDVAALVDRIRFLFDHPARIRRFGENSLRIISRYTVESMAETHFSVFCGDLGCWNDKLK